jgi:hypothetical protein
MLQITVTPLAKELKEETFASKLFTDPQVGDFMRSEKKEEPGKGGVLAEITKVIHTPDGFIEVVIDTPKSHL